jgi:outer membrane lipoprotein-sorting protein
MTTHKTWYLPDQRSHWALTGVAVCLLTLLVVLPSLACAQETGAEPAKLQELPAGREVMAKHIQMTGGKQAYDKIQNRVTESTLNIVGQGISLDVTTYAARPNKIFISLDSKVTGKIEKGTDGSVFWENTLTQGPRIYEGAELETSLRDSTFERFASWEAIYESAECVSRSKVGERECYEVVLTPKKRPGAEELDVYQPTTIFVDTKDYLIRKIQTVLKLDAGEIAVTAYPEDYKVVDGIMMAHKTVMELLGQKREVVINSVKHNIDMPKDRFDLPDEIKKLVK